MHAEADGRWRQVRVLVTNDDGIDAPGLAELVAHLVRERHEVVVAAPVRDASGSGTALGDLTAGRRVAVSRVLLPGHPEVAAYAVHGPPAFAALCGAVGLLGIEPEVVVAGVNPGWNTGLTTLHS